MRAAPASCLAARRTSRSARRRRRCFAPLSPEKRGRCARMSPRAGRLAAGEQAAREHAVERRADAELRAARGKIFSSGPRETSEYSICRSAIGCDLWRARDRLDADLGEADVAHESRLHHVGDGADGVLDRHVRIEARRAVDVDVIDAEARQLYARKFLIAPAACRRRATRHRARAARRTSPRAGPCRAGRRSRGRRAARCAPCRRSRRCRGA